MFQKGIQKVAGSGRKKGTKNKKKVAKVSEYLAELDINPTQKILDLINAEELENNPDKYFLSKLWLELLSYTQAKPKEEETQKPQSDVDEDEYEMLKDVTDTKLIEIATRKENV